MARFSNSRKTTPKVRDGVVQNKDRHAPTRLNSLSVGINESGGRHVVSKDDIWKFIRLIPDWKRASADLDLIYLARATNDEVDGYYEYPDRPTIVLNSWEDDLTTLIFNSDYIEHHRALFDRLGVEITEDDIGSPMLRFDEDSARAFQLLHIFLHELGHHHYRITRGRGRDGGTEKYAESYALKMERKIWRRYCEAFRFRPHKSEQAAGDQLPARREPKTQ